MLKHIIETIRNLNTPLQTKPTKNHTLIDTRNMNPMKKTAMKKETTTPKTKMKKAMPKAKATKTPKASSMMNKGYKKK